MPILVQTGMHAAAIGDSPSPGQTLSPLGDLWATEITATSVSLAWHPAAGDRTIAYTVFYRLFGYPSWLVATATLSPYATVVGLQPNTRHQFEVLAYSVPEETSPDGY